ncbi:hypothetical protein BDZ45DRAFT_752489 [Acephala macrosclerotiorum]|nr:hypothetical protein BDZ45DRAFT_752489 [Acephala macrosclerotiorum]
MGRKLMPRASLKQTASLYEDHEDPIEAHDENRSTGESMVPILKDWSKGSTSVPKLTASILYLGCSLTDDQKIVAHDEDYDSLDDFIVYDDEEPPVKRKKCKHASAICSGGWINDAMSARLLSSRVDCPVISDVDSLLATAMQDQLLATVAGKGDKIVTHDARVESVDEWSDKRPNIQVGPINDVDSVANRLGRFAAHVQFDLMLSSPLAMGVFKLPSQFVQPCETLIAPVTIQYSDEDESDDDFETEDEDWEAVGAAALRVPVSESNELEEYLRMNDSIVADDQEKPPPKQPKRKPLAQKSTNAKPRKQGKGNAGNLRKGPKASQRAVSGQPRKRGQGNGNGKLRNTEANKQKILEEKQADEETVPELYDPNRRYRFGRSSAATDLHRTETDPEAKPKRVQTKRTRKQMDRMNELAKIRRDNRNPEEIQAQKDYLLKWRDERSDEQDREDEYAGVPNAPKAPETVKQILKACRVLVGLPPEATIVGYDGVSIMVIGRKSDKIKQEEYDNMKDGNIFIMNKFIDDFVHHVQASIQEGDNLEFPTEENWSEYADMQFVAYSDQTQLLHTSNIVLAFTLAEHYVRFHAPVGHDFLWVTEPYDERVYLFLSLSKLIEQMLGKIDEVKYRWVLDEWRLGRVHRQNMSMAAQTGDDAAWATAQTAYNKMRFFPRNGLPVLPAHQCIAILLSSRIILTVLSDGSTMLILLEFSSNFVESLCYDVSRASEIDLADYELRNDNLTGL